MANSAKANRKDHRGAQWRIGNRPVRCEPGSWRVGATRVDDHVPALREPIGRTHADRCLPVVLRLSRVPSRHRAACRRLLRVLFVRHGEVPADPARWRVLRLSAACHYAAQGGDNRPHHRVQAAATAVGRLAAFSIAETVGAGVGTSGSAHRALGLAVAERHARTRSRCGCLHGKGRCRRVRKSGHPCSGVTADRKGERGRKQQSAKRGAWRHDRSPQMIRECATLEGSPRCERSAFPLWEGQAAVLIARSAGRFACGLLG